jgi:hypothetical protein
VTTRLADVHPPERALPHTLVAVLTLLTLGAIVLSLWSAPPIDVERLRLAADATRSASGFVLTDTVTVISLVPGIPAGEQAGLSGRDVLHVVYQAPDRVEEAHVDATGVLVRLLIVGSSSFQNRGAGWTRLPARPSQGAEAARAVLDPLQAPASSTYVVSRGGMFQFVPADLDRFVFRYLGAHVATLSSLSVSAVVRGDYLTGERLTAVREDRRITVDLAFTAIGSAPAVLAPPASEVVPASRTPG